MKERKPKMAEILKACCYALLWVFAGLCAVLFYLRRKNRVRTFLLGMFTGVTALMLFHFYGERLGFAPALSGTNLLIASVFGIPGTALIGLGEILR